MDTASWTSKGKAITGTPLQILSSFSFYGVSVGIESIVMTVRTYNNGGGDFPTRCADAGERPCAGRNRRIKAGAAPWWGICADFRPRIQRERGDPVMTGPKAVSNSEMPRYSFAV